MGCTDVEQTAAPTRRAASKQDRTRGAAAIEFALVLPILVALLFGIIEFGRIYNAKLTLANAAREAARDYVITGDEDLLAAFVASLDTTLTDVAVDIDNQCDADPPHILAEVSSVHSFVVPLISSSDLDLTETVVLRCGS